MKYIAGIIFSVRFKVRTVRMNTDFRRYGVSAALTILDPPPYDKTLLPSLFSISTPKTSMTLAVVNDYR